MIPIRRSSCSLPTPSGNGSTGAEFLSSLDRLGARLEPDELAKLRRLFGAARLLVLDSGSALEERVVAVHLLGREPGNMKEDIQKLADLLSPSQRPELQAAAVT